MVAGSLRPVAEAVLTHGSAGLARFRLVVGAPLRPMLAQSAPTLAEAFARTGPAAVEWKLDGIRVQIHRAGSDVSIFTRTLDDVTERVPELVEIAHALPSKPSCLTAKPSHCTKTGGRCHSSRRPPVSAVASTSALRDRAFR